MSERPKRYFDNYPEAIMALGNVTYPVIIKPYECNDPQFSYKVDNYGMAIQVLYDAFEHSNNNWIVIASYEEMWRLTKFDFVLEKRSY